MDNDTQFCICGGCEDSSSHIRLHENDLYDEEDAAVDEESIPCINRSEAHDSFMLSFAGETVYAICRNKLVQTTIKYVSILPDSYMLVDSNDERIYRFGNTKDQLYWFLEQELSASSRPLTLPKLSSGDKEKIHRFKEKLTAARSFPCKSGVDEVPNRAVAIAGNSTGIMTVEEIRIYPNSIKAAGNRIESALFSFSREELAARMSTMILEEKEPCCRFDDEEIPF